MGYVFFATRFRQIIFFCAKNIFSSHLATMAIGSANPAQPERSRKRVGPNRLWPDLNFCVTKRLGRNGFHVTKHLLAKIFWYQNVLLPSYSMR